MMRPWQLADKVTSTTTAQSAEMRERTLETYTILVSQVRDRTSV
jgi:hypothetical protein